MMSRNPSEVNNNVMQQQPTESYNQQFSEDSRSMASRGNLGGYGGSMGGYPEQQNTSRRFTLSATGNDVDLTQQVPIHGGGDFMGNHSQRSHHSHSQQQMQGGGIGYRGDLRSSDSPGNLNSIPQGYPYGQELSPTHLAHRMSLGFYPMSAGSVGSPNYGTIGDTMDLSGRGLSNVSVPPAGSSGALTQDDREEELLLSLLIARRQRGRMGDGKNRPQASLADELMRLRQRSGANSAGQRRSGSIPQLPGMPPLYADSMSGGSGGIIPPNMYPTMDSYGRSSGASMKSETFPSHLQMRQIQDASERVSPGRFQMSDARMSEMREQSERSIGFKRGMGSMGMGVMMGPGGMGMGGSGYPLDGGSDYHHGMGMDMRDPNQPAFKKKRTHKKKPQDMPRRPLSAYNLFFSEERERILREIEKKEGKNDGNEADGIEKGVNGEEPDASKEEGDEEKPKALLRPLIPSQKKRRPHRKTHGKISFQELAKMVGERWKNLPDPERKYYQDLAHEDMKRQKVAMEEYYAKQNTTGETDKSSSREEANDVLLKSEAGAV